MPPSTSSSSNFMATPPHLVPNHHHERHSSEYSEESTILTTRGDNQQHNHARNYSQPPSSFSTNNLASRSKSNPPTKIYGQGMPIPFGVLDSFTPPPLKSSNSSSNVNTKSSLPSPSSVGKNKKEEIQITNTSEWFTLTTQNHDSLFPLEGHQIFYWEQCLEDEDDLTSSVESTSIFNRSLNMIVLFGGTGPIRGNTNQIYCMVPKHSGASPSTNISNSQNCKHQWVPVPSHYIPNYIPPSLNSSTNDIEKLERKSSKSNILSNSNQGSASPRRSSFELSSIAEDGSTEIPLFKSRYDHSLVLCGNNKAYLFGGRNGMFTKTPLQDFILYSLDMDIANQFTWEMAHIPPKNERDPSVLKQSQRGLDDLYNRESPIPRYGHSCCAVNQKQSVLQRSNSTNAGSSQAIIELNSESDTLSDMSIGGLNNNFESNSSSASTGSTRFNTDGGVVLDCAMLLFGGVAFVDYSGSKKCKETNDFWMFNCKERKWLSYPSIIQRYFKNSSSILQFKTDDKYMQEISLSSTASGSSSSNNNEGRKQTKKPASNNIISIHSSFVPEERYGHQMCVVSNALVFIIGGATLNKEAMFKDVWVLSLSTFEWRKVNLLHNKNNEQYINKIPIRYASHVVVGRRILLYGGQLSYKTGDYLTELLCFDTETYRFSIIENSIPPKFDTGLVKATMILYGIDLLIIGGKRGVSSYRYNDSVQAFSFKLHSISKTNQKFIRENTKMKKSNQMLGPNEITFEIPTFGDEDDEFDAANSVKIDLLSQILLSEMSSSDFSRKEALKYLAEVKQIDIVKQLFRNNSIHKALSIIMQSGSKSDIRQTAKVLIRYFKDTDQGTLPFIIARQVLKFIESYLTLINTLIKLREPISQTLHLDYLNLFHLMCQNFEYYESLSKELISVFQQCFKLSDPLSKASIDILQLSISSVEFLSLNAMHFASKCDKETCIIFRDFITLCNEAKNKTAKNLEDNPIQTQGSILKLDELVNKLLQSLSRLSSRSKPIKKYLGKLLRRTEENEEDI